MVWYWNALKAKARYLYGVKHFEQASRQNPLSMPSKRYTRIQTKELSKHSHVYYMFNILLLIVKCRYA